jgi:hypothetical protein
MLKLSLRNLLACCATVALTLTSDEHLHYAASPYKQVILEVIRLLVRNTPHEPHFPQSFVSSARSEYLIMWRIHADWLRPQTALHRLNATRLRRAGDTSERVQQSNMPAPQKNWRANRKSQDMLWRTSHQANMTVAKDVIGFDSRCQMP